jgi:hypothetical protein
MLNNVIQFDDTNLIFTKYLHKHGYEWNKTTCLWAAASRNIKQLVYLHENGCPWSKTCIEAAIISNHIGCIKYCLDNDDIWDLEGICYLARYKSFGDRKKLIEYLTNHPKYNETWEKKRKIKFIPCFGNDFEYISPNDSENNSDVESGQSYNSSEEEYYE